MPNRLIADEKPRYCPHPVHVERSERVKLRLGKDETFHFCDACEAEGRLLALAFGATRRRWW